MSSAIAIAFIVVFTLEVTVIVIGNVFTIFVFWTLRFRLKRTCYLLINLAVADLIAGIAEVASLVIHGNRRIEIGPEETRSPSWAFQSFASCTTLMSLALISLERVFAVLWPLRHRVTNTRLYIYSIVTVWVAGLCVVGLSLLSAYHLQVDTIYATATAESFLFLSLVVIFASYLSICSRLHGPTPELQIPHRRLTEQNRRLSKTFYIVVGVSLLLWLPAFLLYTIREFSWHCCSKTVLYSVYALQLANSMVNPLVYSFRMPLFKDGLKRLLYRRQRRQHIEVSAMSVGVNNVAQNGGFTTHL